MTWNWRHVGLYIIIDSCAESDLQLGARQAEGLYLAPEPPRAGSDQSPHAASELSFSISFLEIGRLRRAISNRTSPPDVQLQIGRLLPASCLHVRSEIGRLPKWDVRFQIGHWIEVRSQNEKTSSLEKKVKKRRGKGLAQMCRARGPTPVARGWLWG